MENIILNIDSNSRDKTLYSNPANFIFNLNTEFKNIKSMKITSFEFPNNFYQFSSARNNLSMIITDNTTEDTFNITISEGNYTRTTLISHIQSILENQIHGEGHNINISLNNITNKVSITSNDNLTLNFSGNTDYLTLGQHLGFTQNTYSGTSITGENVINLDNEKYIYLNIGDITNVYDKNVNNVFSKITLDTDKNTNLFVDRDTYASKIKIFRKPYNISKLPIKLVDYVGNTIDLQGQNFSFTLEIENIYDMNIYASIINYENVK